MSTIGTYDYVVVGGGTAGCIVASRLAEDPDTSVCLIEAGRSEKDNPEIQDFRNWVNLIGSRYDWNYEIEPQEHGPAKMLASRARLLGGCSSHNAVIALKTPDVDLRRWEQKYGARGWGPEGTRAAFGRAMKKVNVIEEGPYSPNARSWIEACVEAGYAFARSNADDDIVEGCGWLPMNRRGHQRVSTEVAYLQNCPDNLAVVTETFVRKVLIDDNGAAVGVETDRGEVRADVEVILSAGVFNTPKLLMLSGVGPGDHLRETGVDVKVDLPAVGEHLNDHIETIVMYESPRPVGAESVQTCEAAAYVKSDPSLDYYDLMIHHIADGYWAEGNDLGVEPFEQVEHAFTMAPYLARPKSEGTVRLRSNDPEDPPVIDPGYFSDPGGEDIKALVQGVRICREICGQPAMAPWVEREVLPGPKFQSDEQIANYASKLANSEYHWAGGCRVGDAADDGVVVDPELRVRGVARLRVADASIFPDQPGVNPAVSAMMVGEKCAELLGAVPASRSPHGAESR